MDHLICKLLQHSLQITLIRKTHKNFQITFRYRRQQWWKKDRVTALTSIVDGDEALSTVDGGVAVRGSLLNATRQPPNHGNNGDNLLNEEEEEEILWGWLGLVSAADWWGREEEAQRMKKKQKPLRKKKRKRGAGERKSRVIF